MAGIALLLPILEVFDNDGDPLSGGKVYTYAAGTSTPEPTFTDSDLSVPNTNPIVLNSLGQAVVYVSPVPALKVVITDADDVVLITQDNISHAEIAV